MGISTNNQSANIGDIDIKDVDLSSIEISTHNGNYQDYEEIDYNQPIEDEEVNTDPIFDIDEKIDESFEPLKPIEPGDKTDGFEMEEIDVIEELKKMIGILDYSISQSKQELEDLNGKYALMIDYRGNYYATERDKLKEQIKSVQQEIATLKAYRQQIQNTIDLKPYQDIIDSSKYASYKRTYDCDYQKLDYELMAMYSYDTTMYVGELMRRYTIEELEAMHANEIDEFALIEHLLKTKPDHIDNDYAIHMNPFLNQAYEKYKYMTEDEIMLYHYLFQTEGMESANAYLALLDDKINQAKGAALAMEFIHGLDLTDEGKLRDTLANFFGVSGRGLIDGIENFFTGLANVFQNNGTLTADDYEKMIILQYLQENSIYHEEIYEFSSSLGNMVPAMVASAIATIIATPAGGATVAGISFSATEIGAIAASTLMGFSAMGNAKHQALVNGADTLAANVYGIFIGASEALLGYFLGNIPGISQTAGFTLSEILQEGVEEYLQEWIEAGLQAVILGQDVDWSEVPANAAKSFFMGVLMSGFLNGGQQIVTVMIDGVPLQIDVEESLKYMEEHNNVTIEEALMATSNNGGLLSRIFSKFNLEI